MDSVLETVKTYLSENHPHLIDAQISVDAHDGSHDLHFAKDPQLPDVQSEHVDENEYHVATVNGTVTVAGGIVIPKILKLTVKDGAVTKALESK